MTASTALTIATTELDVRSFSMAFAHVQAGRYTRPRLIG
jgi:hypothetical protein